MLDKLPLDEQRRRERVKKKRAKLRAEEVYKKVMERSKRRAKSVKKDVGTKKKSKARK
jgi:hypothetical protein